MDSERGKVRSFNAPTHKGIWIKPHVGWTLMRVVSYQLVRYHHSEAYFISSMGACDISCACWGAGAEWGAHAGRADVPHDDVRDYLRPAQLRLRVPRRQRVRSEKKFFLLSFFLSSLRPASNAVVRSVLPKGMDPAVPRALACSPKNPGQRNGPTDASRTGHNIQ